MAVIAHHETTTPKPYLIFLRDVYAGEGRGITPPMPSELDPTRPVRAYVNHGRWIAECEDCRWAVVASSGTPIFYCGACGNRAAGGKWRPVEYPVDKATIEHHLLKRLRDENRNWSPGERVTDLIRENAAAGAV